MRSGDPAAALRASGGGMIVKICGITNQEDAQRRRRGRRHRLGFNFYPSSPRYLAPELAAAHRTAGGRAARRRVRQRTARARRGDRRAGGARCGAASRRRNRRGLSRGCARVESGARRRRLRSRATYDGIPAEALLLDGPAGDPVRRRGPRLRLAPGRAARRGSIILAGGLDAANVARGHRAGATLGRGRLLAHRNRAPGKRTTGR